MLQKLVVYPYNPYYKNPKILLKTNDMSSGKPPPINHPQSEVYCWIYGTYVPTYIWDVKWPPIITNPMVKPYKPLVKHIETL